MGTGIFGAMKKQSSGLTADIGRPIAGSRMDSLDMKQRDRMAALADIPEVVMSTSVSDVPILCSQSNVTRNMLTATL